MELNELKVKIEATEVKDIKLYFITRFVRNGVAKSSKARGKYEFKVYQIDCSNDIRDYIFKSTQEQIDKVTRKNFQIVDYDLLSDETEHLFTYPIKNKVFSLLDVVTNQLFNIAPKVKSIADFSSTEEELWAYCVEFMNIELEEKIFTFRKIMPSKIGIDEKGRNYIRTFFNTESLKLTLLKEQTVNLEEQIDCVYYKEVFYILKKSNFEQIIGLQEEYKDQAKVIAEKWVSSGSFIGAEKLNEMIEQYPAIHKKLIRVEKIGEYKNLTPAKIKTMQRICKKYGDKLPITENKLSINDEKDIDVILRALCDYYKKGEISGKPYGTFAGKELQQRIKESKKK